MATQSSILAWEFPQRRLLGYIVHGITKSQTPLSTNFEKERSGGEGQADQRMTKFCQLLYIDWINKVLLYSMGNSVFSIL